MKIFSALMKQKSPAALALMSFGFIVLAWFIYETREIWGYVIVAIAIAYLLSGTVDRLSRLGIKRDTAAIVVFFSLVALVGIAFALLVPPIRSQMANFSKDFADIVSKAEQHFDRVSAWFDKTDLPQSLKSAPQKFWGGFGEFGVNILHNFAKSILNLWSGLDALIIIPMGTFYFLKDSPVFREVFLNLFSHPQREKVDELLKEIDVAFGGFIRSRLKLCVIVGVGVTLGLFVFRVKYAIVLGLIAGFCEFVPYVGPLVGAIPAVIVGIISGQTIEVAGVILAVQALNNLIFIPKVMGAEMGLHPMVILLALLTGAKVAGMGGMVLSVPLVAAAKIIAKYYLARVDDGSET